MANCAATLRGAICRVVLLMTLSPVGISSPAAVSPPHLEKQGTATRLIVQGKPMLVLGGELANSSASSAAYLAPHWSRLKQLHLNTVVTPVYWELIEPEEGHFDWKSVDALLSGARANDLKLVLLWFGTWKNSMSTYVPAWVKRDPERFPRARLPNGAGLDILTPLAPATRDADAHAFAALMGHLRAVDAEKSTVLMIQVENEVGMLPVARDYSPEASREFHEHVPAELVRALQKECATERSADGQTHPESDLCRFWHEHGSKTDGDWAALFGENDAAAEAFTAWYTARFVESVTAAGKAVYPLPMYVNTALNRPNKAPGEYPSGGPLPHLFTIWKTAAPSLDLLAPDIYFPDFIERAALYVRPDNPLFIPEANNADKPEVPGNAFFAFGKLDSIGFSPFSIDSFDTIDEHQPSALARAYSVLEQLSPAILASQGLGRMSGFRPRVLFDATVIDTPVTETIGNYRFTVSFIDPWTPQKDQSTATHGGLIIQTGPEDYLIAGQGITVTFKPTGEGSPPGISSLAARSPQAGIDSAWEGHFDAHGTWVPGRLLNGDQTHQGRHIRLAPGEFQIQRVRLYRYR
jgi:beta-galactosidase GanA